MSDTYRPGDVANGHYMDEDNKWIKLEPGGPLAESRITTLLTIPRYRVVAAIAAVRAVGRTPGSSGASTAYASMELAFKDIAEIGGRLGGDAVVGLTVTAFSSAAAGVMHGDAVGVIFLGTVVKLEYVG